MFRVGVPRIGRWTRDPSRVEQNLVPAGSPDYGTAPVATGNLGHPEPDNEDWGAPVSTTQAVRETRVRVGARARSDPTNTG